MKYRDLTKGSISRSLLLFALPMIAGNLLQQLYNIADTLIVGRVLGKNALAAVGSSYTLMTFLTSVFLGLSMGSGALFSIYRGKGEKENLKLAVAHAFGLILTVTVVLNLLVYLFLNPILAFLRVPEEIWDGMRKYLLIIFAGLLASSLYNFFSCLLRALGNSSVPLIFLAVSAVLNIGLDILFVAVFRMDVPGAALATILAQFCSWFFSILYIRKKYPELEYSPLPKGIDRNVLSSIVRVGLPLGLNNSIYSIGHVLQQSLINAQGSDYIAACSVASKITGIANVAITSFSSAATTFAGQNLGAQNYARLKKGGTTIPFWSGLITLTFGLIITAFCRPILMLFTRDAAVLDLAVLYTRIVLPSTWTYAVFNGIISFVNGMGEVRYPTIVNLLMLWAVRIPSAWLINRYGNGNYVVACFPISFTFGMLCMLAFFLTRRWKNICARAAAVTKQPDRP